MNKLKITITALLACFLIGSVFNVDAQTTNAIPTLNFFQQAMVWGASLNMDPTYNWTNDTHKIQIDTGVATTTGVGIADRLNIQDNFGSFGIGIAGEFTGVGSTFNMLEGTIQYSLYQKGDFKMTLELGGGYDFNAKDNKGEIVGAMVGEPGIGIYKVMTPNSYAVFKLLMPVESHGKFETEPKIFAGVGGTF